MHLTQRLEPPLDLAKIKGDPSETGTAWASGVISAKAGASFDTKLENVGWKAGVNAKAGGGVALAVHQRHAQTDGALDALVGLLPAMTSNPFTLSRLRSIGDGEIRAVRDGRHRGLDGDGRLVLRLGPRAQWQESREARGRRSRWRQGPRRRRK